MFTCIEATVEDTHSPESIQESEPLMIQQASVYCTDHMESTGLTPVLPESMSTDATDDKEPASLSNELRQPNPQDIEATVEDTHSPESIQESEPRMIQQASVDCGAHMESTGFTPVLPESMSTDATEDKETASLSHELRQPNPQVEKPQRSIYTDINYQELPESEDPCMATARRGMKRKWTSEDTICFMDFFRDEIRTKKMPAGPKIMQSRKILTGRTVAQIRTRVHNIIRDKQKAKKKC